MKLRLLVDSSRQNPAPGELVLLVAEFARREEARAKSIAEKFAALVS